MCQKHSLFDMCTLPSLAGGTFQFLQHKEVWLWCLYIKYRSNHKPYLYFISTLEVFTSSGISSKQTITLLDKYLSQQAYSADEHIVLSYTEIYFNYKITTLES